ncbi:hypothetical protein Acj9p122 [Acinetobacter phage Acj9]|uniref:Uncharacterized protein n=1 Tax=Acinetobacter phage Acj9 TaxID=760939 RepID=E5EPQ6_9CAUD|nr:hypothetical protein Acj9p122 [Acinetobacter phage Acj9]ADG60022.1 hypothetical protein Acj9p122 [Acinetobacter phage Acj9]
MNRKLFQEQISEVITRVMANYSARSTIKTFDSTPIRKSVKDTLVLNLQLELTKVANTGPSADLNDLIKATLTTTHDLAEGMEKTLHIRILRSRWAQHALVDLKMKRFGMKIGPGEQFQGLGRDYNFKVPKLSTLRVLLLNEMPSILAAEQRLTHFNDGNPHTLTVGHHESFGEGTAIGNIFITATPLPDGNARVFLNPRWKGAKLNYVNALDFKARLISFLAKSDYLQISPTSASNYFEVALKPSGSSSSPQVSKSGAMRRAARIADVDIIEVKISNLETQRDVFREKIQALEAEVNILEVSEKEIIQDISILKSAQLILSKPDK